MVENALIQHAKGDLEAHRHWIGFLLNNYYDPMYHYQMDKKKERVVFAGNRKEIIDWLFDKTANSTS